MEITYLKKSRQGKIWSSVKIMSNGNTLDVQDDQIQTDTFDNSFDANVGWWKDVMQHEECNKEEFDTFFIKTVKNINELSKL